MATNRHRSYGSQVAFIDLLFNTLVGFVFLFILAFILINPIAKKSNVEIVAEFIVKINWPSDSPDDIDLWMRDPLGNYVGFKSKDVGLMALSRDDLGTSNDTVYDPKGKPIIVLINNGSASASEIFAGALKDHKRAIILGESSYGKGSVQSIIPLRNGGGMRLTISKYYLPSGKSISEVGVTPDILVEEKDNGFSINTENDNQLNYAIKLLNS